MSDRRLEFECGGFCVVVAVGVLLGAGIFIGRHTYTFGWPNFLIFW